MATDDLGNQRVAFEWGNMPMQPNNDRTDDWVGPFQTVPPALGAGDSHAINGVEWNTFPDFNRLGMEGRTLEGGDAFYWPSRLGVCNNNPKTNDGRWEDLIEYLRTVGVNPEYLKEATFTGGSNKYDWQDGDYDSGIIFWSYIPADVIIWINWETGTVYTGKDFDGLVVGSNPSPGQEVSLGVSADNYFFTVFTNDPAKNNTAGWL